MTPPVSVRRVTDPEDPALAEFGRIQQESYYAPEMLIPPEVFPHLVSGGGRGARQDRILVAQDADGPVLGGTVYHLLPEAGFNSFLAVGRGARGRGVGRALHRATLEEVRGRGLPGIFADSVFPDRQDAADREAEARTGVDPAARRRALHALGLRTVDLPYWQPVGGPNGGPLTDLDLLFHPLDGAATVPTALVTGTLQAYWGAWLGEKRARQEAEALAGRAGRDTLRLLPATETPGYWREREQRKQNAEA
ncbi:GNAT family N-acetyltransferase [Deinococcus budaensis]|uniref:GNAT superfamily N-acetyltransferase n=1 Tax=Deinococcus budaensis TaxID=1665626 RepID=A0A7W8LQ66_9DEIO|nr:GNAT family N-acetyltransferase [Deinococcus budaensis]MBB5234528.1 GNAT superfamily N-acetyltransferase [Deinococcus budaensis]